MGWESFAINEIESAVKYQNRRLSVHEKDFLENIKKRLNIGFELTVKQQNALQKLHAKKTEVKGIW